MRRILPALAALALALVAAAPARALEKPTGKVVLVVTGAISETNSDHGAEFDMAMLERLPGREAMMKTPWTEGETKFSGPLGREILKAVGAKGTTVVARALDDYSAEIPIEDFVDHETILASRINGAAISVRDKGPLFVIYPFDKEPSLYNEKYFSRSVWQVKAIEIR